MDHNRVVVIGAGASGLLCAIRLTHQAGSHDLDIAVVDPAPPTEVGLAYATRRREHLMNVRSAKLSAHTDRPNHFVEWLARNGENSDPSGFAPRSCYRAYLLDALRDELDHHPSVRYERLHARAIAIDHTATHGARVSLDTGSSIDAHHVVIASGHRTPRPLGDRAPSIVDSPWDERARAAIGHDASVVLVGSGLTAVDVAVALLADGHRGRITMVSRHGRIPQAHDRADHSTPPTPCVLPVDSEARTARQLVRTVRRALADARAEGRSWESIVDGLRPVTVALWRNLEPVEQARLLRHARSLWDVHRHRMAPDVAAAIAAARNTGRLHVQRGRVQHVRATDHGVLVETTNGQEAPHTIAADAVVNCTGVSADVRGATDPFTRQLLSTGIATPAPFGLGLTVDADGALVDAMAKPSRSISVVGPVRTGCDFETTAIPELRQQAASVAERVLRPRVSAQPTLHSELLTTAG
ncbi:MAG TPA: FAD/NAD(P)-binding protein [Acidimicrobiia bacterium]|jgi:uncharacterized NAD(P)/FAD-binding protein YdhS